MKRRSARSAHFGGPAGSAQGFGLESRGRGRGDGRLANRTFHLLDRNVPHARAEVLAALQAVNLVVVFDQDTPLELIRRVRPKVLAKGSDYRREEVVGHALVESDGGQVILIDLVPGFSTTKIVRRSRAPQSN